METFCFTYFGNPINEITIEGRDGSFVMPETGADSWNVAYAVEWPTDEPIVTLRDVVCANSDPSLRRHIRYVPGENYFMYLVDDTRTIQKYFVDPMNKNTVHEEIKSIQARHETTLISAAPVGPGTQQHKTATLILSMFLDFYGLFNERAKPWLIKTTKEAARSMSGRDMLDAITTRILLLNTNWVSWPHSMDRFMESARDMVDDRVPNNYSADEIKKLVRVVAEHLRVRFDE